MANKPKVTRGHFSSLWTKSGDILVPTTLTTQRKSFARVKEQAKRNQLLAELSELTGEPHLAYPRAYDGIVRRWTGVKNHGPSD
jgi:hypothetical protein